MIIRPTELNKVLRTAVPVPTAADLTIDETLRRLTEIIDRDRSAGAIAAARRERRNYPGHARSCVGY